MTKSAADLELDRKDKIKQMIYGGANFEAIKALPKSERSLSFGDAWDLAYLKITHDFEKMPGAYLKQLFLTAGVAITGSGVMGTLAGGPVAFPITLPLVAAGSGIYHFANKALSKAQDKYFKEHDEEFDSLRKLLGEGPDDETPSPPTQSVPARMPSLSAKTLTPESELPMGGGGYADSRYALLREPQAAPVMRQGQRFPKEREAQTSGTAKYLMSPLMPHLA